jgi:hypothetical protein
MKYRVVTSGGAVVGVYDAASEDEVLDKVGADSSTGYATRAAAEDAAMNGAILIEAAE